MPNKECKNIWFSKLFYWAGSLVWGVGPRRASGVTGTRGAHREFVFRPSGLATLDDRKEPVRESSVHLVTPRVWVVGWPPVAKVRLLGSQWNTIFGASHAFTRRVHAWPASCKNRPAILYYLFWDFVSIIFALFESILFNLFCLKICNFILSNFTQSKR